MTGESPLLRIADLSAGYGPLRILDRVGLECPRGAITALVGSNGAGKTTLMAALAGLIPTTGGSVDFDGAVLGSAPAHLRVARGLVLVPEGRMVFSDLSVADNLKIGAIAPRGRSRLAVNLPRVYELFPRLAERRRQLAGTLSGGEQQMLALGRALMAEPVMLLLDEPSLGLAPIMARQIFGFIAELARDGLTILLAEQDLHQALTLSSRAYVLENGRVTMQGTGAELAANPDIRQAYLGL